MNNNELCGKVRRHLADLLDALGRLDAGENSPQALVVVLLLQAAAGPLIEYLETKEAK